MTMTGLEKIMEDIRQESGGVVSKITEEAGAQAAGIGKDAQDQAEKLRLQIQHETERKAADSKARAASAAQLQQRQSLLACKQELIAGVLQKALQKASALPAEEYFAAVIKMAAGAAHAGAGEICFNQRDLGRLPAGFEAKLNKALKTGASLHVSKKTAEIDSGFLLLYNGIEENCSFDAVLAARHEELQDKVRAILFP